jgi:hypothetical protein
MEIVSYLRKINNLVLVHHTKTFFRLLSRAASSSHDASLPLVMDKESPNAFGNRTH